MDFKKFLMFGDSITEFAFNTRISPESGRDEFCVGAALTNAYTRKLQVTQRGFSGYNSRWALKLLPQILATERDIVIAYVFFGTNDAAMDSVQTVPLVEYVRNMTEMVQMLHAANIKVVLVGPALHDAHKWLRDESGSVTPGSRNNANNKLYSDALAGVAREQRTGFVDLHRAFSEAGGERWSDLLVDGIHYSGRGYEVFYKELMAVIDRTFPELSPDNVPFRFPNWRDVAPDGSNL